jgi:hypothetical protein
MDLLGWMDGWMIGWMDDRMVVYSEEGKGIVTVPWSGDGGRWSLFLVSRAFCESLLKHVESTQKTETRPTSLLLLA